MSLRRRGYLYEARMVTLKNDFHGTETKARLEIGQKLTRAQARRIRQRLCPKNGCQCAQDALGQRDITTRSLELVGLEVDNDGNVVIYKYDTI
jgi:hypothetical protein